MRLKFGSTSENLEVLSEGNYTLTECACAVYVTVNVSILDDFRNTASVSSYIFVRPCADNSDRNSWPILINLNIDNLQ